MIWQLLLAMGPKSKYVPSEIKLPFKQRNCLKLLEHPDAVIATTAITDHGMFLESNGGIPYSLFELPAR